MFKTRDHPAYELDPLTDTASTAASPDPHLDRRSCQDGRITCLAPSCWPLLQHG